MTPPNPILDLLTLQLTPGLGPQRIAALLEHFGSAARVLAAGVSQVGEVPGIGPKIVSAIRDSEPRQEAEREIERATRAGVRLIGRGEDDYPAWLANIPTAPPVLFLRGDILPTDERAVAIIGTRHPTASGKRIVQQLADGLARAGVTVVSGLARGIDGLAHRAALDAGGRTLAVLAGGLARLYPPEHAGLGAQVSERGSLITESPMDQEPLKGLFPARNRIISGLSRVIVIVQAGIDSGALITAEHAAEQNRPVMAVPGAIDDEQHAGCHKLLREGAILCRGVADILEELDGVSAQAPRVKGQPTLPLVPAGPPPGLDETQRRIWEFLAAGPRAGDEIAQHLNMSVGPLSGVLLGLEMRKVVKRLPGNRYER